MPIPDHNRLPGLPGSEQTIRPASAPAIAEVAIQPYQYIIGPSPTACVSKVHSPTAGRVGEQRPIVVDGEIIDGRKDRGEGDGKNRKTAWLLMAASQVPMPRILLATWPARNAHQMMKASSVVSNLRVRKSPASDDGCQKYQ